MAPGEEQETETTLVILQILSEMTKVHHQALTGRLIELGLLRAVIGEFVFVFVCLFVCLKYNNKTKQKTLPTNMILILRLVDGWERTEAGNVENRARGLARGHSECLVRFQGRNGQDLGEYGLPKLCCPE